MDAGAGVRHGGESGFGFAAIASSDEDRTGKSGMDTGFEIEDFVADDPGASEVEVHGVRRMPQHTGVGLAEIVVAAEVAVSVGVIAAGKDGIDAGRCEAALDFGLHHFEVGPLVVAASDPSLVGDDDCGERLFIQPGDGLLRLRDEQDVFHAMQVVGLFDNDAVAVEEDCRRRLRAGRRGAGVEAGIDEQRLL